MGIWEQIKWLFAFRSTYNEAVEKAKEAGVDPKSILTSWTFWFNVLAGVYELLDKSGVITSIPAPWDGLAIAAGNILLRFKTVQPVALPGK